MNALPQWFGRDPRVISGDKRIGVITTPCGLVRGTNLFRDRSLWTSKFEGRHSILDSICRTTLFFGRIEPSVSFHTP
jgi:hypothetical protein